MIDIFDWQEEIKDMISMQQLARELYVDDKTVRNWVKNGRIVPGPDFEMPMGQITYRYFKKSRVDSIRELLGIEKRTADKMKDSFMDFVQEGGMSASYKPVMLKRMITLADDKGEVDLSNLVDYFRKFYEDRADAGLPIEAEKVVMNKVKDMSDHQIAGCMLRMPFEKFE